jgi:hypothetical protein
MRHWIGSWVSPKTRLGGVERRILNLLELEHQSLRCPARSQSQYRLRHLRTLSSP